MHRRNWVIWVGPLVGWMLIGLLFSVNDYLFRSMLADYFKTLTSFWDMVSWDLIYWPTWALLAPLIFWIARRFPLRQNNWHPNLIINLSASLFLIILQRLIYLAILWLIFPPPTDRTPFLKLLLFNLPLGFMSYCIILLVPSLIDYARNQQELIRTSRSEAQLKEAQLQVLRLQVQPHFVFNTLSYISALLNEDEDIKTADRMILRLGDFLRLTSSKAQIVTLDEELNCLRHYLEIEEVRLEKRLHVTYDVEPDALGLQVPNLILQPIIENAIKHGVRQSFGQVQIVVSAKLKNETLSLGIKNTGGERQNNSDGNKEGLGIKNTRERLKSAYGPDGSFDLRHSPDGWTVAIIEVPILKMSETSILEYHNDEG